MASAAAPVGLRGELGAVFQQALDAAYPDANDTVVLMPCNNPKFGEIHGLVAWEVGRSWSAGFSLARCWPAVEGQRPCRICGSYGMCEWQRM